MKQVIQQIDPVKTKSTRNKYVRKLVRIDAVHCRNVWSRYDLDL